MSINSVQGFCEILYEEQLLEEEFYISVQLRSLADPTAGIKKEYILNLYKLISYPCSDVISNDEIFPSTGEKNEEAKLIRLAIRKFDEAIEKTREQHKWFGKPSEVKDEVCRKI